MPFVFECPQCGSQRLVGRHTAGRRVRCPACEALIELALPASAAAPQREDAVFEWLGEYTATAETAEARLPRLSGTAIHASAEPLVGHAAAPTDLTPHAPVLAMADDGAEEEKVLIKSKAEDAEMDMTPMVDVTFLLLIFFMITASFTMQKSMQIPKPQEATEQASTKTMQDFETDPDFVTIRIDRFGTYTLVGAKWADEIECPSEQELRVKLREARGGDANGRVPSKVLVIANGEATHERVVTAVDSGASEGFEDIQLLSVEDDESA